MESGGGVPAGTAGVLDRAAVDCPHLFEVEYGAQLNIIYYNIIY